MARNFHVNFHNLQPDMMKYMICDILFSFHNNVNFRVIIWSMLSICCVSSVQINLACSLQCLTSILTGVTCLLEDFSECHGS